MVFIIHVFVALDRRRVVEVVSAAGAIGGVAEGRKAMTSVRDAILVWHREVVARCVVLAFGDQASVVDRVDT